MNTNIKRRNLKLYRKKEELRGSFEKGDQLERVLDIAKSQTIGQLMCKVEWKVNKNNIRPE